MAKVEIENLTRSTWIFPAFKPGAQKGDEPIPDPDNDIIVGDRNNTAELFAAKGVEPCRKWPLNTVVVDQKQIDALPPTVRKVFEACLVGDPGRKIDGRLSPLAPSLRIRPVP